MNGVALGTGVGLLAPAELWAGESARSAAANTTYPPTLTGMRGSHEGSYEVAHALAWEGRKPAHYEALDEQYDLVVVGAGISLHRDLDRRARYAEGEELPSG